jgi:diguanylate cyclase (GGDEF)-like protein
MKIEGNESLIGRFRGKHGKKNLINSLCRQQIIAGDRVLATEFAEAGELMYYPSGESVMSQGSSDSDLYFLLSGQVRITINSRNVAIRTAGEHVGEMALIDPTAKRSATVSSTVPVIVLRISEAQVFQIASRYPDVWRRMAAELSRRLRLEYATLYDMAVFDGLTRIHNRTFFMAWAEIEFTRAIRMHTPFSIALVDIDFFKMFNDTFGHDAGDFILKAVANLGEKNIRKSDVWARWGGEEFILALPDTNEAEALRLSDGLRMIVERHKAVYEDNQLNVTVSVGISTYDGISASSIDEIVKEADKALYTSKKAGRNRATLFENKT